VHKFFKLIVPGLLRVCLGCVHFEEFSELPFFLFNLLALNFSLLVSLLFAAFFLGGGVSAFVCATALRMLTPGPSESIIILSLCELHANLARVQVSIVKELESLKSLILCFEAHEAEKARPIVFEHDLCVSNSAAQVLV
jgi:hypothetical protein